MLHLARRTAAAAAIARESLSAAHIDMLLPPAFLCPMLAVGGDYRSGRRRKSTAVKTHASRRSSEAGPSTPALRSTQHNDPLHQIPQSARRRLAVPSPTFAHSRKLESRAQSSIPTRSMHKSGYSDAEAAYVDLDDESLASSSFSAKKAAERADSIANQVQVSLAEANITLSQELSACVEIAIDVMRNSLLWSDVRGQREILDESTEILYAEAGDDPDTLEIVGAVLCAAYLRLERSAPAEHILSRIVRHLESVGRPLQRKRWSFVVSDADGGFATDFIARLIELLGKFKEATATASSVANTSLHRFREMLSHAMDDPRFHEQVQETSAKRRRSLIQSLNDATPTPQVFSALALYQVRRGDVDALKDTAELQMALLPDSNLVDTLCHVLHLHPRVRRPGILFDILGNNDERASQAFGQLSTHLVTEGRYRQLVGLFRAVNIGCGRRETGPAFPLDATLINDIVGHLYLQVQPKAAIHFFKIGIKYCHGGDLTKAFLRVCWALQEAGIFGREEAYLKELQKVGKYTKRSLMSGTPVASSEALRPSRMARAALIKACASAEDRRQAVINIRMILRTIIRDGKRLNANIMRAIGSILPRFFEDATWEETSHHLEELSQMLREADEAGRTQMRDFVELMQVHGHLDLIVAGRIDSELVKEQSNVDDDSHRWVTETRLDPSTPQEAQEAGQARNPSNSDCAAAKEMDLDQKLSSRAYGLRLRIYGVIRRDHDSAQAIFQSMLRHGVQPTVQHVAVIIESLIAQNRLNDARVVRDGIFARLGDAPIALAVMTTLIRAFARQGRWADVHHELRIIEDLRIQPDRILYAVISAAVRSARLDLVKTSQKLDELASTAERIVASKTSHGKSEEHSVSFFTPPMRKTFEARRVTGLMQAKMRDGRLYEAQCDVAEALEAGLRSDKLMHEEIKDAESYIRREIEFGGYDAEELLSAVRGELSPTSPTYERFNSPMHFVWGRYDDGSMTIRQRKRWAGPPKHPRELGYALHLVLQNREASRLDLPGRIRKEKDERNARKAMMQLIHDAFASNVLQDEVNHSKRQSAVNKGKTLSEAHRRQIAARKGKPFP